MRTRRMVRAALLLALTLAAVLEAVVWVRIPLEGLVHRAYPWLALDAEGRVVNFDHRRVREQGRRVDVYRLLDDRRMLIETRRERATDQFGFSAAAWRSGTSLRPFFFDRPRFLLDSFAERVVARIPPRPSPLACVAIDLNRRERVRRKMPEFPSLVTTVESLPGGGVAPYRPLVEWQAEAGRLVCREVDLSVARPAPGRVLAGLGPDGFAVGESGAEGGRFGDVAGSASHAGQWWLLEREPRRLAILSIASEASVPPGSLDPLPLRVDTKPMHDLAAPVDPALRGPCWIARLDAPEHLLLLDDGSVFGRFAVGQGERIIRTWGVRPLTDVGPIDHDHLILGGRVANAAVGIEIVRWPAAPGTERRRLLMFRPGQPPVERDVAFEPARASERLPANLAASLALVRPLPLSALSTASNLAENWHEWWWRDPWLAGGRYGSWLVLSFALAAFCAWRARRAARERCGTLREVRLWTAAVFLLGPVGLLWMKLVFPRVPMEAVGQARRAVNLDASPSTAAPWPDPKPLGIEVIS